MDFTPTDAARLSLLIEQLVRAIRPLATDDALSQAAAAVLSRLDATGPGGVTDLARAEGVSQPAMTQLVARLNDDGLLSRTPSPTDRRSVVVTLTDAGRAALATRRARRTEFIRDSLMELDGGEQRAIVAALPALGRLVEATRERGAAGE
ncbi:MarR family transcriptional regulator [Microbacterium sorbitolivorans]|uniref:MarR family transcriptional regulator n=1 Tax=Microbacterium sorbitolivorans TaxID=1867410 RepID=A0A367Y7M1_9MICO|nr:MarR family transcriptional regulator [Microbacterium sorbitolivorans]RCK61639.1 MarR family transcriptional regulator [Microbacterium sorbitolivorans]GGF30433.1 MarR family transcriptional regulator [Microbacterium sorbitolivorans]